MGGIVRLGLGLLAAGVLVAAVAGCGSGGSTGAADTVSRPYPWVKGPARSFLVPGGDNVVPASGEEGTPRERAEATAVITAYLRARAARDWKRDCSYLSHAYVRHMTADAGNVTNGGVHSCEEAVKFYNFQFENHGNFTDTLGGPIDSLRVGGGTGIDGKPGSLTWALYHGTDGNNWTVELEREHGRWRIARCLPLLAQH